jgi:hypothetical protein
MKKSRLHKKVLLILGFTLVLPVRAETYTCSAELSRYGRAGETETNAYVRKGSFFERNGKTGKRKFEVVFESDTDIVLTNISQYSKEASVYLAIINKTTSTYMESFNVVSKAKDSEIPSPPLWGNCISFR